MRRLQRELIGLGIVFIVLLVIMFIAFRATSFGTVLRSTAALMWMLVIPGYALLYYWRDNFGFGERVVMGSVAAAAVFAVSSYYLGILGLTISVHGIIIPIIMIGVGIGVQLKK